VNDIKPGRIGAVVLAAGLSTRMGKPKMIMPWGKSTIIETVVTTLTKTEVFPIIVITGGAHQEIERSVKHLPVQTVFNPLYYNGEMLVSLQLGLKHLPLDVAAILIVLGDQPAMDDRIVREIIASYRETTAEIIVPSYQMRRGHPWLVDRSMWNQILSLTPPQTLRDFNNNNRDRIRYLVVDTPSILQDLDTPEDYETQRPNTTD